MSSRVSIRRAVIEDLDQVAEVHVRSWHSTYEDIVAAEYLQQLSSQKSKLRFHKTLSDSESPVFMYVAEIDDEVIGFASGGPNRGDEVGYTGELYAIYLLKNHQGNRIGRRLTSAVVRELCRRGMNSMIVWAFQENHSATRFYERMGGQLAGEKRVHLGEQALDEIAYGWTDLKLFSDANE